MNRFLFWFIILCIPSLVLSQDFDMRVWVNPAQTVVNGQFSLNVELSGKDLNSADNPQLPEMEAFAVYLGSGSTQNMSWVNGQMSISRTLTYHFRALKEGEFTIKPVTVNVNGKTFQSESVKINILPQSQSPPAPAGNTQTRQSAQIQDDDLFLEVNASKNSVYQNEPVVLTYRIYSRVQLNQLEWTKLPETSGFWVEEFNLGQIRQQVETHNDKRYNVAVVKKMALFPISAGEKIIDPLIITCHVTQRSQTRDLFSDFFDSPFGRTVPFEIQSEPVKINVIPLPQAGKPENFSGIVGQYEISAAVNKNQVQNNEALTYKITVSGRGNIKTLPEPKIKFSRHFEVYPPKITENISHETGAISGSKVFEYILVPRMEGVMELEAVQYPVFDSGTGAYRVLRTRPVQITVTPGDERFTAPGQPGSRERVRLLGTDIRYIKTQVPSFKKAGEQPYFSIAFLLLIFIPWLGAAAAVFYRQHLDRLAGDMAYARGKRASRLVRSHFARAKKMMSADQQKAFYTEIGRAIPGFIGDKLNIPGAGILSENIPELLRKQNVPEAMISELMKRIEESERIRFAPETATEQAMRVFFDSCVKIISRLDRIL